MEKKKKKILKDYFSQFISDLKCVFNGQLKINDYLVEKMFTYQ